MKKSVFVIIFSVGIVLVSISGVFADTNKCLTFSSDLKSGQKDASVGGPIRLLQEYLVRSGYLTATPNGRYGPATVAAVRKFQVANSISSTGTVGPLTRALIQKNTCAYITPVKSSTTTIISGSANVVVQQPSIISPKSGEILTLGASKSIEWNNPTGLIYDFILERDDHSGGGYITTAIKDSGTFSWRIGQVMLASSDSPQIIATGTYRIRLQKTNTFTNDGPVSGWFQVVAPPLSIKSITPSSVVADDVAAVVIFGSGLTNSTIYLDEVYHSAVRTLYTSPDGTVSIFTVPKYIGEGLHKVLVRRNDGVVSNEVELLVLTN